MDVECRANPNQSLCKCRCSSEELLEKLRRHQTVVLRCPGEMSDGADAESWNLHVLAKLRQFFCLQVLARAMEMSPPDLII